MAKSRSIGGIYASLSLKDGAFTAGMKRAGNTLKAFGATTVKYGSIAAGVMGGALAVLAKRSVSAASDLSETFSKSDVVFGRNSETMKEWAGTAAKSFGLSKNEALSAASTLGNMFDGMGLGADKAADMSKSMVQLAADLGSFNNTSSADALEAISAGIRGESEPLRRYGVLLDDATLKAEAMSKGLYNGVGSLTPVSRAMAAYGVILKQTTTAQGDFGRTSSGLANSQKIIAAQLENATAEIGMGLLPAVQNLANAAANVDFEGIGKKLGAELAWGVQVLTDGKAWDLFKLYGEQALLGLQQNFVTNGLAAEINSIFDALTGEDSGTNYYQAGLDGTLDKLQEVQDKIDDINRDIAKKIEDRDIKIPNSNVTIQPFDPLSITGIEKAEKAPKSIAVRPEFGVNEYQRRGLSLSGNRVETTQDKQTDLLTQIRDGIRKLTETTRSTVPTW